jgi:hypothetical protein
MAEGWLALKSTCEVGMKISAAQREYYRYTGASAELERQGAGSSRAAVAWVRRSKPEQPTAVNQGSNLLYFNQSN